MKADSQAALLGRRLLNRLRRLGFFPFTLVFMLINAAIRAVRLRQGYGAVRVGEVTGASTSLPSRVTLWLARVSTGLSEPLFDVCLRLPREATNDKLHDVFSVLLTSPRLRSVGLYWDSWSLADDLPLLQARHGPSEPTVGGTPYEDLDSLSFEQLCEYFQSTHDGIVLPVAANRDAQTLLKRQAGKAYAVCLNVPVEIQSLADTLAARLPDFRFFDLAPNALPLPARAANSQSLCGYGLSLHERTALVQAADAYVGHFDELGCAALVSGRPAVLLGGGTGEQTECIGDDHMAVWFPVPGETAALAGAVIQFLSRQLGPPEIDRRT